MRNCLSEGAARAANGTASSAVSRSKDIRRRLIIYLFSSRHGDPSARHARLPLLGPLAQGVSWLVCGDGGIERSIERRFDGKAGLDHAGLGIEVDDVLLVGDDDVVDRDRP